MAILFRDEPERQRYALYDDDELLSVLDYRISGDAIAFPHTYTVPTHRGHGYGAELVSRAIADVETQDTLRVIPMCWFVAKWFEEHPEKAALLGKR